MNFTYLLIDVFSVAIPFLFTFHPKIQFNKQYKYFWPANLAVAAFFLIWDSFFTSIKIWGFSQKYTTGLYIFNLPVEEVLFFICIPYACVFSYHCFQIYFLRGKRFSLENSITPVLILLLLVLSTIYIDKLYTSVTFILLSGTLFYLKYVLKVKWLDGFYFTYAIMLLPFLAVNGVLTGTFLEEPVVWYDEANIIGIRLLTIPFEDIFYGMLLILLNIFLYLIFMENIFEKK